MVLAAVLLFRGLGALWESVQARNWPVAQAVVTTSESGWVAHHRALYRNVWSYQIHMRYIYTVNGQEYTGTRIRFSFWGPNENFNPLMSTMLRKYPVGTRTLACFDPLDPSQSVLDASPDLADWLAVALGIGLVVIGVGYARRVQADKRAAKSHHA